MKNDGETQASTKGTISVRLVGEALVEWRRQGGEEGEVLQAAGIDPQLLGNPTRGSPRTPIRGSGWISLGAWTTSSSAWTRGA